MLHPSTIKFLKDLKKNNNKPWFEEHRPAFDAAKKDFELFIETILHLHAQKDRDLLNLKVKECMFRINRDVRFAKDKSPYKTNMGASLNRGGKKSLFAGYYFHCEPGQSFAGGGIWFPMPNEIKKVRQEIDYCFDEFRKVVESNKFKTVFGELNKGEEYSLVNVPKGYEKDNPAAGYLKLKSCVATRALSDADLVSKDLTKKVIEAFQTLQPMVKFLNRAIDE
ncbi:MAG: DUF2461 domain-containing protein [Chitinophagaceae bacterium]